MNINLESCVHVASRYELLKQNRLIVIVLLVTVKT